MSRVRNQLAAATRRHPTVMAQVMVLDRRLTPRRLRVMRLIHMRMATLIHMPTLTLARTCMPIRTTTAAGDKPGATTAAPISDPVQVSEVGALSTWNTAFSGSRRSNALYQGTTLVGP